MTLQEMLNEARAAYHALMTTGSVLEVRDQNGELVRYSRVDASKLLAYIKSLEFQLTGHTSRPLRPIF